MFVESVVGSPWCAQGLSQLRLGGRSWRLAAGAVMLLGPLVGVIALFNEYAGQQSAGANIHLSAVCALGALVGVAALLVVPWLRTLGCRRARRGLVFAIAWATLAPLFFVVLDGWNGGYERGLALMLLVWVTAIALLLVRHARRGAGLV